MLSDGRHETVRCTRRGPSVPRAEMGRRRGQVHGLRSASASPIRVRRKTRSVSWAAGDSVPTSARSWRCCTDGVPVYSSGSFQHLALLQEGRQLVIADAILRRDLTSIAAPSGGPGRSYTNGEGSLEVSRRDATRLTMRLSPSVLALSAPGRRPVPASGWRKSRAPRRRRTRTMSWAI
jgi:hypothetical protein